MWSRSFAICSCKGLCCNLNLNKLFVVPHAKHHMQNKARQIYIRSIHSLIHLQFAKSTSDKVPCLCKNRIKEKLNYCLNYAESIPSRDTVTRLYQFIILPWTQLCSNWWILVYTTNLLETALMVLALLKTECLFIWSGKLWSEEIFQEKMLTYQRVVCLRNTGHSWVVAGEKDDIQIVRAPVEAEIAPGVRRVPGGVPAERTDFLGGGEDPPLVRLIVPNSFQLVFFFNYRTGGLVSNNVSKEEKSNMKYSSREF